MDATFRSREISQSDAEKETNSVKPVKRPVVDRPGAPVAFNSTQMDSVIPPLEIYEAVKGRPYIVDHLGFSDIWNIDQSTKNKVFGDLPKKVGVIEGWIKRQLSSEYQEDKPENTTRLLKMIDKVTRYSSEVDPLKKMDRIYSFIVNNNKARAFKQLRKSLVTKSIDELVDTKVVKASLLGQFMQRKDG